MKRKRRVATDAVVILERQLRSTVKNADALIRAESVNAAIARDIYRLRIQAGLSQRELADRVGTTASAVSRLESADYEGHSLKMLMRIADALGRGIEVRFVRPRVA